MTALLAAIATGIGLAVVVVGLLLRTRDRDAELLALLDLPYGEDDVRSEDIERLSLFSTGGRAVDQALGQDVRDRLGQALERARVPLRPGEAVLLAAGASLLAGAWTWAATGQAVLGVPAALLVPVGVWLLVQRRIGRRQRAIEQQLPGALSLVASSLQSGHSFMHAVDALRSETEPPLSEELDLVVAETRLGDPVVDALDRMATRVGVPDLEWVVQAIRIQQEVGGRLADLLFTLADYLRARDELRREVQVLTAEGRLSAVILAGLPAVVLLAMQLSNPGYVSELFHGAGLVLLVGAALSVAIGVLSIVRLVKVEW
ncbi:MAG TPA: type II secretion system F family protein [Nitriliruptorales bacterium]